MAKITYSNKSYLNQNPSVPSANKVEDVDMNEIKSVVNGNDTLMGDLTNLKTTDKSSIVNALNETIDNLNRSMVFSKSSNQSIATGTFSNITFQNTVSYTDTDFASVSSGTFTVLEKGLYLIILNTIFDTNATGGRYQDLYANNVGYAVQSTGAATGARTSLNSSAIVSFNANDTFVVRGFQASGSNLNVLTNSNITMVKIK